MLKYKVTYVVEIDTESKEEALDALFDLELDSAMVSYVPDTMDIELLDEEGEE